MEWHCTTNIALLSISLCIAGLNSMVLASNNEMVLLPINEPTFGTPR